MSECFPSVVDTGEVNEGIKERIFFQIFVLIIKLNKMENYLFLCVYT